MYTVAGVSTQNGSTKVRFANDFVNRCKVLARNKHTDIKLVELPRPMDKEGAVAYLSTLADFADVNSQAALSAYLSKKQGKTSAPATVAEEDTAKAAGLAKEQAEIDAEYAIVD